MDKLPVHLAAHAGVFASCAEIVHCDSFSDDGTKSYVSSTLRHPGLKQCDHPPGLYQSWNHAIQQTTQDYIYISTVGDSISPAALSEMLALAQANDADVVISPPCFVDEQGHSREDIRWPTHRLIANHQITADGPISSALILGEAILNAPDGILGSSASCLYRGSFLRARPFPLGFHGACDSVWALRHITEARCVIIPRPITKFLLHEKSYESHGLLNAEIAVLVRAQARLELNRLRPTTPDPLNHSLPLFSHALLRALRRHNLAALLLARANLQLIKYRMNSHGMWVFNPSVWITRWVRNRNRALASRLADNPRTTYTLSGSCQPARPDANLACAPMGPPLISVLIPCYNQSRYIGQALESVLAQQNVSLEILVSDDSSKDDTADIARRFAAQDPRVRVVRHEKNLGMAANWNWCLAQARGEFIKFVFGDDFLTTPDALALLLAPLIGDQPASLSTSARQIVDANGQTITVTHDFPQDCRLPGTEVITRCLLENKNLIGEPSAVMFRRAAARPFDPSFRQLIDVELWYHLLAKGEFVYIDRPLCAFRRHEQQQTAVNQPSRLGEREGIRLHLLYGSLLDRYLAAGESPHLVRQAQFRTIYYANKATVRSEDQIAHETELRKQLKRHWYMIYWLHHRLTKPLANLRRALGLPPRKLSL